MTRHRNVYWTAAVTHFAQERRAAHHVERQGFQFYLPEILSITSGGQDRREILFPGYVFVRVSLREEWRSLASTRGIARLLLCGETPTRIPDAEIDGLRAAEDERGFVQLQSGLRVGDEIVGLVGAGGYEGVRGIVRGTSARDRVRVLLRLLGRLVEVDLDRRAVALA